MKRILLISAALLALSGCVGGSKLLYKVAMSHIEAPTEAVRINDPSTGTQEAVWSPDLVVYEDNYIRIGWSLQSKHLRFDLTNKSGSTIMIPWDEAAYITHEGLAQRVLHSGVKFTDRNLAQTPSVIPNGTTLRDMLIPSGKINFVAGPYGGWNEEDLFPIPTNQNTTGDRFKIYLLGKKARVLLPLLIGNVKKEYLFELTIMDAKRPSTPPAGR